MKSEKQFQLTYNVCTIVLPQVQLLNIYIIYMDWNVK